MSHENDRHGIGSDTAEDAEGSDLTRSAKRARNFIARQACNHCRQKKTRCDEEIPCGQCQSLGIECRYVERKQSKNEVSLNTLLQTLRKIDSKVSAITSKSPATHHDPVPVQSSSTPEVSGWASQFPVQDTPSEVEASSLRANSVTGEPYPPHVPISFSAHQMLSWPAVDSILPNSVKSLYQNCGHNYATKLEVQRPALSTFIRDTHQGGIFSRLTISAIKSLSDFYFSTFNLANPVLDKRFYYRHTLGVAINGNFGFDIESCVVLTVMALGCLGRQALAEAGLQDSSVLSTSPSVGADSSESLNYFNEARRRIGFLMCDNALQSCQYYLLAALYNAQMMRPTDCWAMVERASSCCIVFWESVSEVDDAWLVDVQSRLFWNTVMFEAILTQELQLPVSKLRDFEDKVPLPKFVKFQHLASLDRVTSGEQHEERIDSIYHFHFLAQIAHRIILSRVQRSVYYFTFNGDYARPALFTELLHQLEQWRLQLPPALQFEDAGRLPMPESPGDYLVVPFLHSRYIIAKYHLARPLFHKALHRPDLLTAAEVERCSQELINIIEWMPIVQAFSKMKSCAPLRFASCSQLFGQFLLVYCFKSSTDSRLQNMVKGEFEAWCVFVLEYIRESAPYSPTLALDAEMISTLLQNMVW